MTTAVPTFVIGGHSAKSSCDACGCTMSFRGLPTGAKAFSEIVRPSRSACPVMVKPFKSSVTLSDCTMIPLRPAVPVKLVVT